MRKLIALLSLSLLFNCGNSNDSLVVKGQIKGLKKGTIYLKKATDSTLVTLDSVTVNGETPFELKSNIDEPQIHFLYLDKNDAKEDRISFFADKGVSEIQTTLKNFAYDAEIKGSKQQDILNDYLVMMSKFNNKSLELIKENFDALRVNDTILATEKEMAFNSLKRRKYLYTTNFALNHKNSEVAPYLALTELYDANIKLLDTINNALNKAVKTSLYGKNLQQFIDRIKTEE
ncbi:DUF4369 domain-containing protein [Bizionia gelidisalsuginis]|uniref:DUF4369 domain-containing protein n=1 Tax=Bizionia gelidisalsuginis TaxID=291188 RepID=A0ABY3M8R6_9FLAO|nr:DUF4369 domain-containing protein [Bizionia gelidisalsuginis]TYC10623.1 DUF4369 domain-containing protein [Bizionia gelidisalsuginis]